MLSHISASLAGLVTIRSQNAISRFVQEYEALQDRHSRAYLTFIAVNRWLGVRLDLMCWAFGACTVFVAVATRSSLNPGLIGLSLSYILQLTALFQWCVRQVSLMQGQT